MTTVLSEKGNILDPRAVMWSEALVAVGIECNQWNIVVLPHEGRPWGDFVNGDPLADLRELRTLLHRDRGEEASFVIIGSRARSFLYRSLDVYGKPGVVLEACGEGCGVPFLWGPQCGTRPEGQWEHAGVDPGKAVVFVVQDSVMPKRWKYAAIMEGVCG